MSIAILVLTHNRLHLLTQCVERVLRRTSEQTSEILIWDNASTDGTHDYLDGLDDPRVRVIHSDTNIGQNAYAQCVLETSAPYLIELDDDIVDAPAGWDAVMLDAFQRLPDIGFLAADLVDDPNDVASRVRHHERADQYELVEENGIRLLRGPTGGGCAITSRELNSRVGGFRQDKKRVFWLEDEAYVRDLASIGFGAAVLADLQVHHTGGEYYRAWTPEKAAFWAREARTQARKDVVKRVLLAVPFVRRLNRRRGWFAEPQPRG